MAPPQNSKKRKGPLTDADAASDDELANATLEGILSGSEDEDDEDDEDFESSGSENSGAYLDDSEDEDEDEADEDEDDAFLSDEIPSDDEGRKFSDGKLAKADKKDAAVTGEDQGEDDEPNYRVVPGANGGVRYEYDEINPVYDSDDSDAQEAENTIGNIPLSFYDSYPHIGYDINGKKIMRPATGEALDALLETIEIPKGWTGLTDPATGKPLNLTQDQLELLRRVQMNEIPEEGYDPYPVSLMSIVFS